MAISPDDLNKQYDQGLAQYNQWCIQTAQAKKIKDEALATLKEMCSFNSLAGFVGFLSVMMDCMEQMGATLGLVGAGISQVSHVNDYFNTLQSYFAMGREITPDESIDFSKDMQNLYIKIGGQQAWQTGVPDPNACPSFLTTDQQSTIISYLNTLSKAYFQGGGFDGNQTPEHGWNDSTAIMAQANWWKTTTNPDGSPKNPDPSMDPNFNSAQMTFQQMSTYITSLNSILSTRQKYFSDQYEHCEASAEKIIDFFTNADGVKVNNQRVQ